MLQYLEYLKTPTVIGSIIVGLLLVLQLIGEIMEVAGKTAPELLKIRKYFARKKRERETLEEIKVAFQEFNAHYSADNIKMRDEWIRGVNHKLEQNDQRIKDFDQKLDTTHAVTLDLLINSKRETIINFAAYVIEEKNPVTREQFKRIFKIHKEYDDIIEESGLTNGEVDIAYRIITESYETHMRNHSFVEDVRGYNN